MAALYKETQMLRTCIWNAYYDLRALEAQAAWVHISQFCSIYLAYDCVSIDIMQQEVRCVVICTGSCRYTYLACYGR